MTLKHYTTADEKLDALRGVFTRGAKASGDALGMMMGREIQIGIQRIATVPYEEIYESQFRADSPLAIIILGIEDDPSGFLLLMMYEQSARAINNLLWAEMPCADSVLSLDNISALKEMGNIVGSGFLNALADSIDMALRPTAPIFVYDMLAAVMQTLLVEHGLDLNRIMLIESHLACNEEQVAMEFLFLPTPDLTDLIAEKVHHG